MLAGGTWFMGSLLAPTRVPGEGDWGRFKTLGQLQPGGSLAEGMSPEHLAQGRLG